MTFASFSTTRRRLLAAGVAGGAALAGYRRFPSRAAEDSLRMLCWAGYDNPEATAGFTAETGLAVHADYVGANDEFFTFLRAGGIGEYDIVTPSDGVVGYLADVDLIQPIDVSRLKNASLLFPQFVEPVWTQSGGEVYAIPLMWRTAPMVYNADKLTVPPANWTDLTDPSFKGKVALTDDVVSHFLTWNKALGATDPARVSTVELSNTVNMLIRIKRDQAAAFVGSPNDLAHELAYGRSRVSTTGTEAIPSLPEAAGVHLALTHPDPGDFSVCDALCIPVDAPHLDAAYAFIDHMIAAEAQAILAGSLSRGTVNPAAVSSIQGPAQTLFAYGDLDVVFGISPLVGFPPLVDTGNGIATYVDWVVQWDRIRYTQMLAFATPTPTPSPKPFSAPYTTTNGTAVPSPTPTLGK